LAAAQDKDTMSDKLQALVNTLKGYKNIAVAFSGGVDSSFLAAVARDVCDSMVAITIKSEFQSKRERENALSMAEKTGFPHVVLEARVLGDSRVVQNTQERCYFCKKMLFTLLKKKALDMGYGTLVHGANVDDLADFRPGFKAALEMGVLSPLVKANLAKDEIRHFSRNLGLDTWDMPSQSCLATRIPYGESITLEKLAMVESGEEILHSLGFRSARVRCHGNVARIELDPIALDSIMVKELRHTMVEKLKKVGFSYVALDLEGYVSGSMNRSLPVSWKLGIP